MLKSISLLIALLATSFSLHAQTWIQYNTANSNMQSNDVRDLTQDGNQRWAATGAGLHRRFSGIWAFWNTSNSPLPSDNSTSVLALPNGDKVVTMDGGGVSFFDGQILWANFQTGSSNIPNDRALCAAHEGNDVWVGTMGGAAFWNGMLWTAFTTGNSGLPSDTIYGLAIDALSNVWFATPAGLARYDGSNWTVFNANNSPLPTNQLRRLRADPNISGSIWICTDNDGIIFYDGTTWQIFTTGNSGLLSNHVTDVAPTPSGMIWFTTHLGLSYYDGSNWGTLTTANSPLPTDSLQCIYAESPNRVWIGTYDEGVLLYDTMTVGLLNPSPEFSIEIGPQPLETRSLVRVSGSHDEDLIFELYDLRGNRLLRNGLPGGELVLERNGRAAGVYFYAVRGMESGRWIGGGKLVIR